jgi:hypothetical protein
MDSVACAGSHPLRTRLLNEPGGYLMKRLIAVLFLLGVSACGASSPALGDSPTVGGQLGFSQLGTIAGTTVIAQVLGPDQKWVTLSTGTIDASGTLSIMLPNSKAVTPYLPATSGDSTLQGCSSVPVLEPQQTKELSISLSIQMGAQFIPIYLSNHFPQLYGPVDPVGIINATYLYVDRDATVTGQLKCDDGTASSIADFNLTFSKGWNLQIEETTDYSSTASGTRTVGKLYTGELPAGVKWQQEPLG